MRWPESKATDVAAGQGNGLGNPLVFQTAMGDMIDIIGYSVREASMRLEAVVLKASQPTMWTAPCTDAALNDSRIILYDILNSLRTKSWIPMEGNFKGYVS